MRFVLAYIGAGAVMALLDFVWLSAMGPRLYKPALGDLLAAKPDMRAAVAFYLFYLVGIVVLAILPALRDTSALKAVTLGAVLGFVAYATYDLTNQATLRTWPIHVTLMDMAWGTLLTSAAALGGYWLATRVG